MDGIYVGEHVVQFKDQRITIVPFLIPIEDESMGLRPIQWQEPGKITFLWYLLVCMQ